MKKLLANLSVGQLSFYLFCTFPAFISIKSKGLVAIVFLLMQLYVLTLKKPEKTFSGIWFPILQVVPFIFFVISLTYSTDLSGGLKYVERLLLLFILPWVFYANRSLISMQTVQAVLRFYASVMAVFVLYCFSYLIAAGTFVEAVKLSDDAYYIIRTKLEAISGFHPTYISIVIAVALFSILYELKHKTLNGSKLKLAYLAVFVLVSGLILASSKMIVFCTVLGAIIIFSEGLSFKAISGLAVKMLVLLVLVVAVVQPVRERVLTLFSAATEAGVEQHNPDSMRKGIYKSAMEVISENVWLGTGVGDNQEALDVKYEEHGYSVALEKRFNTHNQYLQFWLSAGIIPFLLFIGLIIAQLMIAIYSRNFLHIAFIVLMSMSFMSENVLSRQDGIFVYVFFSSLFCYASWSKNARRVFVNGRYLTQPLSGVQRYATEITHHLNEGSSSFTTLVDKKPNDKFQKRISWPFVHGLLWEQMALPIYLKSIGSPLLINLCNSAPLCYKNQFVTVHDTAFKENPSWFSSNFIRWYSFMIPRTLNKSKLVITVSEFSKSEIVKHFGVAADKIHVLYNGMPRFSKDGSHSTSEIVGDYALTVGSISERKNQVAIIEAFLKMKNADLKLVVAGSYNDEVFGGQSGLRDKLKARDNIIFVENPSDDELSNLYANASFTIYIPHYEGFGLPVVESIANNKLTLVSDIPVFRELFSGQVEFLKSNNYDNIAIQIEQIYLGENQVIDAEKSEKTLRDKYSYEDSAKKLQVLVAGNNNN